MPSMRHPCDVHYVREGCHLLLFSVMLAKKNVRMLFYRMCYHYSLEEEQNHTKGIKRIDFQKRKSDKATFQNADPLYSDLTELAKRKPVAKKSGEN
jgi:hypothetical protein